MEKRGGGGVVSRLSSANLEQIGNIHHPWRQLTEDKRTQSPTLSEPRGLSPSVSSIKLIRVCACRTRGCISRSHSCFLLMPSWLPTELEELRLKRSCVSTPLSASNLTSKAGKQDAKCVLLAAGWVRGEEWDKKGSQGVISQLSGMQVRTLAKEA